MAPSSSDMLSQELRSGAMDFQQTGFLPEVQTPQQNQFSQPPHQQQHQQQLPQTSQAQAPSQPFPTDSYQSQHQPQHAFASDSPQHHHHQHHQQQRQQPPPPPQQQTFSQQQPEVSSDSYRPHHVLVGDVPSERLPASNGKEHHPQQRHPNSFANITNNPHPAASSSASSSSHAQAPQRQDTPNAQTAGDPQFDIFEWYPKYQSCQRYFVDHAQHSGHVHAVAAFVNIALPFQRPLHPIPGSPPRRSPSLAAPSTPPPHQSPTCVSLIPYLRRLVVTGLDFPGVLHGFFGDDWVVGVGPLHEQERRNYLFAAKSGGWASVKKDYDMLPLETVPFMRALQGPVIAEIEAAEKSWSEWLAMEDWMVGPRAPENMTHAHGEHQKDQVRRQ